MGEGAHHGDCDASWSDVQPTSVVSGLRRCVAGLRGCSSDARCRRVMKWALACHTSMARPPSRTSSKRVWSNTGCGTDERAKSSIAVGRCGSWANRAHGYEDCRVRPHKRSLQRTQTILRSTQTGYQRWGGLFNRLTVGTVGAAQVGVWAHGESVSSGPRCETEHRQSWLRSRMGSRRVSGPWCSCGHTLTRPSQEPV